MKVMAPPRRARYLARAKARCIARLRRKLEDMLRQDLAQLSPASQQRLADALERLPREIPTELVERLRTALAAREVAV